MNIAPINFQYKSYTPTFKANNWSERTNGNYLIHETAFFREPQTDEFVKNYLVENFLSKGKPANIVVGACSTGEEVYSQAMLYDEYSDLVLFPLHPPPLNWFSKLIRFKGIKDSYLQW